MPFLRLLVACAVLRALAPAALAQPGDAPLIPLEELQPDMVGEVWTVFRGSQPEAFAVKVTGVLRNALGPGKSLILCELTDPRVQSMGAVAGMSGSPLYLGGRLAGVLSYQIQRFETVRHAGFTPIADLMEVSALPEASPVLPPNGALPLPVRPIRGESARATFAAPPPPAAPGPGAGDMQPLQPVFSLGGISPLVARLLEPEFRALGLGPLALGGHSDGADDFATVRSDTPATLQPGGVVAAAFAVGDITLAASGTVSRLEGNRLLAFGHPIMTLGATELPMAEADIVGILPSQLNSVKVGNTGRIIGTFSQDRLSGTYGELGRQPHLVPIEISLPQRLHRNTLNFSVVRHELLLPTLAVTGLSQAVLGSNEAGFNRGFKLTATVDFPGAAPVVFTQLYPGQQGFAQGVGELSATLQLWLFNPYARTFPDRIRFTVEETPETPVGFVELLQLSRQTAAPGDTLTATLTWRGYQRGTTTETLTLPIPPEWAGKQLELILAPGPALDEFTGAPRTVAIAQVRSFAAYLEALRAARANDGLYLAIVERTRLFTDQRATTPELPGSLERIARGADETRFQRRDAAVPLWETHLLPGLLFSNLIRKPLTISE